MEIDAGNIQSEIISQNVNNEQIKSNQKIGRKGKTLLMKIITIITGILLILILFLFYKKYNFKINKLSSEENGEEEFFDRLNDIVEEISNNKIEFKYYTVGEILNDNGFPGSYYVEYDLFWKNEEGLGSSVNTNGDHTIKEFITDKEINEYDLLLLQDEKIKDIFKNNGFIFNKLNSVERNDTKNLAFEKDSLKCVLSFYPIEGVRVSYDKNISPRTSKITIDCSNNFSEALENQREILDLLDSPQNNYIYSKSYNGESACKEVSINLGTFDGWGGCMASFIGLSGEWIKIMEGQDGPLCIDLNEKNIPEDFIDNCNIPCYPDDYSTKYVNYKDYLEGNY